MGRNREFDRDQVLDRAVDVFWTGGYEATSLDELTVAMGIGRGSLYNEFGDKHALFVQSLDRYRQQQSSELRRALQSAPSAWAGIGAVLSGMAGRVRRDSSHRGCLLVNSAAELGGSDAEVADRVNSALAGFAAAFRESLERGQREGEFNLSMDTAKVANYLASTLICLRLLGKFGDAQIADHLVEMSLLTVDTAGRDGER